MANLPKEGNSFFRQLLPDFSIFLTTIIWGMTFTILKLYVGPRISPFYFIFIRFLIAGLIILPFCLKSLKRLGVDGIKSGIYLGVLLFAGFGLQSVGIIHTTASKAGFITGLSAVFVPVFLFLHVRQLPRWLNITAIVFAMLGMYLLTEPWGGGLNFGDILVLICAITFGAQIYYMGIATAKYDTIALTFVEIMTTAAVALIALPFEQVKFELSKETIIATTFMIIMATSIALMVQTWAQKRTSAVKAGIILTAEPVFAYIFASIILGEYFSFSQKLGGAIVILAVIITELIPFLTKQVNRTA